MFLVLSPIDFHILCSPSWNYPLYQSLIDRRPLPVSQNAQPFVQDPASSFSEEEGEYNSEDTERQSFIDTSSSSRSRASGSHRKSSKKKKKRKSSRNGEDSDSDAPAPLADSIHHHRQANRLEQHPIMSGKGGNKASRASARAKRKQEEQNQENVEKENQELRLKLRRIEKKLKLNRTGGVARNKEAGSNRAMQREVHKCTKQRLWKICKFLRNQNKLDKATKFVMEKLQLADLEGLEGAKLVDAQEIWKATFSPHVRTALNKQRNYVQQELRELMEKEVFQKGKEDEFPNEEQILDVALRNKLDDETPEKERALFEKLFDNYWNVLMPKVAGHLSWGPSKRHYELMSTGKEDEDSECYVTASDEAFLVLIWLNCYKKWRYRELLKRDEPDKEVDEEHEDMKTPYTDSKGGQKKFGGWNEAGIKKFRELEESIKNNREKENKYILEVEEQALERIRKVEQVAEKEANRKTKKRKKKVAAIEDESTDDENDYGMW